MLRIVKYGLFSDSQCRRCGKWFSASQIAGKAGMRTAGDLYANPLATVEAVGGRPDVDLDA